jgi:hypothetical protein
MLVEVFAHTSPRRCGALRVRRCHLPQVHGSSQAEVLAEAVATPVLQSGSCSIER